MPAFKLTKKLCIENKIDYRLIQRLKDQGNKDEFVADVLHLLRVENAREQIDQLKKVVRELTSRINSYPVADDGVTCPLQFLVHLFFICTTKNPARRVLISAFQGFQHDVKNTVIIPAVESALVHMFQQPIRNQEDSNCPIRFEESYNLRHSVDTLSALLENFSLGEDCVRKVCLEALSYLAKLQQLFYSLYGQQLSPVQRNETMYHCLETVKLANRICQRSSVAMETRLHEVISLEVYADIVTSFIKTDLDILRTDDFLIDCKTTSGMNICLMLKYSSIGDSLMQILSKTVFQHIDWFSMSHDSPELPDWMVKLNFNQLSKSSLTSSSYLCLCYGILAMVPMEMLLQPLSGKCALLDVLLQEFLSLSKSCTDVGSKLLVAKSVCFLTQRLRNYLLKATKPEVDIVVLPRLRGDSVDMQLILNFVYTSWEDSVDAIRFTVKDIFEYVVAIHLNTSPSGLFEDDPFLHKLTLSILHDVSWSCKGKYGTLSILVGHLGSARMLQVHNGIAADVLQQLQEQTLACYAGDLYETLFKSHMTELHPGKADDSATWFTCWVDPVIDVLCGTNKIQKQHSIEYVLPKLLKTGQATLYYMIHTLTAKLAGEPATIEYDRLGIHRDDRVPFWYKEQCMPSQSGHQLGALIMCLRRARAMGQLQHKQDVQTKANKRKKQQSVSIEQVSSSDINLPISEKKELKGKISQSEAGDDDLSGKQIMQTENNQSEVRHMRTGPEMWYGIVDVDLLRQALICKDEQIRLDAFALLCENQKTTETILDIEMGLIQTSVPQNLNNQNPSFRQHFISNLKKFLSRMKESFQALKRQAGKNDPKAIAFLLKYKTFLRWLVRCLFQSLYPGSVFARRTTCLGTLSTLMNIYGADGKMSEDDFIFYDEVRPCDIQALVHCLADTFEDNKMEASAILISCSKFRQQSGVMDAVMTKELTDIALNLSQSTRPQDSTTAAYMFQVLVHQPCILKILQQHVYTLFNGSEADDSESEAQNINEANIEATEIEKEGELENEEKGLVKEDDDNENEAKAQNEALHKEKKATENGNEAKIVRRQPLVLNPSDYKMVEFYAPDDELGRQYLLLWILAHSLEAQTKVAKSSLIVAAANRPLYPTMQCMRHCFSNVDLRKISKERLPPWVSLLARFIRLCLEISEIVSPVVHNCSPEGNVPVDSVSGANLATITKVEGDAVSKSHETVMLMPEYLVVCCWRSIKEISLILGQLTSGVLIVDTRVSREEGLLTYKQILDIGEYFTTQLLDSKHRGAFELAYAGFVKVTEMLWRSSIPELHGLPKKWLSVVMKDIKSGDPESRLCATRRSAGVPFYVQALVSTEPTSTGRACFKDTMQELLTLASDETIVAADTCNAKVHALNILRALYKDARLKDDVAPYVADGLKVAIIGFQSQLWAVCNSATLLMTAMMVRIFGVKRSKDETSFSRKNCQTGRTFFHNYPSLYQFLLDQITVATQHITNQLHPGLFPILMVLGRLFPSAMEGTDTSLNIASFIPYVIKCSSSPVLKTRIMAAKALQPLVDKDHVIAVFSELLAMLPCQPEDVFRQNCIHGILLQLRQMLKTAAVLSSAVQTRLGTIVYEMWTPRMHRLISRLNPCLLTRKESLEVTAEILELFGHNQQIHKSLVQVLREEMLHGTSCSSYDNCIPALSDFLTTVCRLYVEVVMNVESENSTKTAPSEQDTACEEDMTRTGEIVYNEGDGDGSMKIHSEEGRLTQATSDVRVTDGGNQTEAVILKFLNSESYEVRKTILSKLREICVHNNNPWKTWLPLPLKRDPEWDTDSLEDFHNLFLNSSRGVYSCLESSDKIYGSLLAMVDAESREECQVQLFRLLQLHPFSGKQGWLKEHIFAPDQMEVCMPQIMDKLLDRLQTQTLGDPVVAAIIDYMSVLMYPIYSWIGQTTDTVWKEKPKWLTQNKKSVLAVIRKWIDVVGEYCQTESSPEIHVSCARAIKVNWESVMVDVDGVIALLDDSETKTYYREKAYRCVLDLLQADDLEVKDAAADIADVYLDRLKAPTHPYVSTDLLLDRWILDEGHNGVSQIGHCLVGLICEDRVDDQDQEERLFDRGESNTYWDEIDIIQTADCILLRYSHDTLGHLTVERDTKFSWHKFNARFISKDTFIKPLIQDLREALPTEPGLVAEQQQLFQIIREAVNKFFRDNGHIASSLEGLGLKDMFLNSAMYQKRISSLFRTLIMVKYGILLSNDAQCKEKCQQLWDKIASNLNKDMLLPVICDAMETVVLIKEEMSVAITTETN